MVKSIGLPSLSNSKSFLSTPVTSWEKVISAMPNGAYNEVGTDVKAPVGLPKAITQFSTISLLRELPAASVIPAPVALTARTKILLVELPVR